MGSVGRANTGAQTPAPGSQTTAQVGLHPGADDSTIKKYYSDQYGITIGGSWFQNKLDSNILVSASKEFDFIRSELGEQAMKDMAIRLVTTNLPRGVGGETSLKSGKITVNASLFKDENAVNKWVTQSGSFHPKNSTGSDVIIHELGHNIEFLINKRANPNDKFKQFMDDANQTYARAIVQQAYAEVKKENPGLFKSEKAARASISGYADSKWRGTTAYTETMAEAVSDYARNKDNASALSKKIWEGIKAML